MDRGAWGATVHGVAKSRDRTERLSLLRSYKPDTPMIYFVLTITGTLFNNLHIQ